ncbi:MAG: hypothetical protein ABS75_21830 [Pelagibacterium sp. SCN 63-23]|nr:MAG: hypothetical protein ABS75_21830 [Pelagibacterium sp. SCN 63-23]
MKTASDRVAESVKLSRPAHRALVAAGIITFADLAARRRRAIADLHGVGPKSLVELDPALRERGLEWLAP